MQNRMNRLYDDLFSKTHLHLQLIPYRPSFSLEDFILLAAIGACALAAWSLS
jgi:hypothetical protein